MSSATISTSLDSTGWTLEMTGSGDRMVCVAIKPDGGIIGIAHMSAFSEMPWSLSAVPGLPTANFRSQDDAVTWLTYLADLSTRAVSE